MQIDVRTIVDDEVAAWCAGLSTGFLNPAGDVDADARRPGLYLDRTWAAFDGDRVVATLRSFPTRITVPGGSELAASAVTAVTTTATHRRRGLASRMVWGELAASKARGEAMSILIAAEWGIYGRFGYGPATEHQGWTVDAAAARFRRLPEGTVEYVDRETARTVAAEVHDRHRRQRPGEIVWPDRFWDLDFGLLHYPSWPEHKPAFHVLARNASGVPVGVARYEYEDKWAMRQPKGEITVQLFVTAEPAGDALLWYHLISLDRVVTVHVANRPADELLPWLLTDARHAQSCDRADFLWIRPLDVPAMLTVRCYPVGGYAVIEVVDEAGLAGGRFALDAGPEGASCTPTGEPAQITLGVSTLASIYLGGYPLRTLAAAGLVDEAAPGAVARVDAMFRAGVTPSCSTWF